MVKTCIFSSCSNNSKNSPDLQFIPFVKPWMDSKRAKKWLEIVARSEFSVEDIKHSTYVCQKHFLPSSNYNWKTNSLLEPLPISFTFKQNQIQTFKSLVEVLDAETILECVGEKLFDAFTLTELEEKLTHLGISQGL